MSNTPTLPPGYTLRQGYPSVRDYIHLRSASGLSPHSAAQAEAAMRGSWYGCYITYNGTSEPENADADISRSNDTTDEVTVGMGRVIGDGGWYFHIADMAVLPEHQRKGLGDVILKDLMSRIRSLAPPPERAPDGRLMGTYVSLFADVAGRKLYARNGFVDSMPHSMGMVQLLDRESA
ncbi:GNAT family N-acetyltransferase [Aspergillus bombycis]|uniref:GNAT family N-acetyltransferase n=1 Tax=Aspergillus bombycis TaxID=109264 RepID=A0A1F8A851_9EURO|nr:GNAT family N-acetyltransferase [Aspergillus bombycis]OGM47912.1 GNAT family N-acetyltransferase [Aspergillus bombycis]